MSGKITPSSVLVIKDGNVKLVNIKNQDTITRLLDMIPDLSEKFSKMLKKDKEALAAQLWENSCKAFHVPE